MSNGETTQTTQYGIRPRTPDDVRRITQGAYLAAGTALGSMVLVAVSLQARNPGLFFGGISSGVIAVTRTGDMTSVLSSTYIDPDTSTNTTAETTASPEQS